jgi:carboxymethylenebutenolidase
MIEYARPDGKRAPGYLSMPTGGEALPGIVMLEEWWGLTDHIRATADRLAASGYRVLVPDLFRGRTAAVGDEANHLAEGLDFQDAAFQDARGAAQYLKANGHDVGAIGFCMGGALAMLCAMYVPEFKAVVDFYGFPPPEAGDPATVKAAFLGHFANDDDFFPIERVDEIEKRLREGGVTHEIYRYDAKHGFHNPNPLGQAGLGHYNKGYAEIAWTRTIDFFKAHLR